ncbi:MAG: hypothetical protein HQK51_05990 [Oligoflexia bacterium]|nr:hypothetical protein [Oligoflexia bacterium]
MKRRFILNTVLIILFLAMPIISAVSASENNIDLFAKTTPRNCFDNNKTYCHTTTIKQDGDKRYTEVMFWATIDASNFPSSWEVIHRYLEFEKWQTYLTSTDPLRFTNSKIIDVNINPSSHEIAEIWHYFNFGCSLPNLYYAIKRGNALSKDRCSLGRQRNEIFII